MTEDDKPSVCYPLGPAALPALRERERGRAGRNCTPSSTFFFRVVISEIFKILIKFLKKNIKIYNIKLIILDLS